MSTRSLPLRPNLGQLKIQANELHRAHREGQPSAAARIAAHHPEMNGRTLQAVLTAPLALADAQLVVAREYGFNSWAQLKHRVELASRIDKIQPHPRFDDALAALDAGDLERLRSLIASDPTLARARTNLEPPYGYFTGATLLHHVAGNPGRDLPLATNIVEIARALLDAGADVNALTLGPAPSSSPITRGSTTMGLVITSKQASDAGVAGPLMDLLLERGATVDVTSEGALDASLANHAPRAAEKLIELGARPDVLAAAALGRMDLLRSFFDTGGIHVSRRRRQGTELTERDAIGLAMLYAYVRGQHQAVDFLLEKDGNWDITGVNNGTALHRAAWAGDLAMVQRLVAQGADVNNRDNPFGGTPMGWASYNKQADVVAWLQRHTAIDLHDAVAFDLRDHVEARLRDDPASVNRRIDDGETPQGTPLHAAARRNRGALAKILLENGADPNVLAGNGLTALDIADAHGAAGVAELLEHHGGRRTAEAGRPRMQPAKKVSKNIADAPFYGLDEKRNILRVRHVLSDKEWDTVVAVMAEKTISGLDASGHMTDAAIERIAQLEGVTRLDLGGSKPFTDTGLRHLGRLPRLQRLDLTGCRITDRGLDVLRELPELRWLQLCHHGGITDAGMANLASCHQLEHVNLMNTTTGDGAITALTGKPRLSYFMGGNDVTDAGVARFHDFPVFKTWHGGDVHMELMSPDARPNFLWAYLKAPFMRAGIANLSGLDGLFALSIHGGSENGPFDSSGPVVRADGLSQLVALPNLGWLGIGGELCDDDALSNIGAMPRLRMLMAQGAVAGDDGFSALSRSATIEYIWGRECPNLTGRGFSALSGMPALRGLAVSCKNVDDAALSALPRFPALRELMPMDVQDEGFRHVGGCEQLEALWCMYCRDTTDVATEHIARLSRLKTYYAGKTRITDRSLEILSRMSSLERLTFWQCAGITDAGVALLANLPRLREVQLEGGMPNVTLEGTAVFPPHIRVEYWA